MWDGVRPTRGGRAFCGHFLTSHLTHSKYALIDWLSNYIRALGGQRSEWCFSSAVMWEFSRPPCENHYQKQKKRLIKVEVGPGCGPAGATVGPLLTLLKLLTGFLSWSSQRDTWTVNVDVLANEPESLFEDYVGQVHRALLNKILFSSIRLYCRYESAVAALLLFIKGWSNGYF